MIAMIVLKALVAFLIAAAIAWVELVTSKYPRTIRLFWKRSRALWTYAIIYGLISFGFTLAYVPLTGAGLPRTDRAAPPGANSPEAASVASGPDPGSSSDGGPSFIVAVMLGLSAKALLHIRLFSVPAAGTAESFPVGTETVVQLFEPWLLRTVEIDEFNEVATYLEAKAKRYTKLDVVRQTIKENLPRSLPEAERAAILQDVEHAIGVRDALEIYLRAFGVSTVDRRFPS